MQIAGEAVHAGRAFDVLVFYLPALTALTALTAVAATAAIG
jgi:hypothetical protein